MKFGLQLSKAIYAPWKEKYLDYNGLKKLLKRAEKSEKGYTEEDESTFVEKLDAELEKIYAFQNEQYMTIIELVEKCEQQIDAGLSTEERQKLQLETDEISNHVDRLAKYARVNYTGVVKIVKKHDKRTGYILRPLFNVRLAQCKFFGENYDPVLYRLSKMYQVLRGHRLVPSGSFSHRMSQISTTSEGMDGFIKTSFKFWVHPDNFMEIKTFCARHLPILIYNPSEAGPKDGFPDPSITSIYFDNDAFDLYMSKIERRPDVESFRLRWYGSLKTSAKSEIYVERKIDRGEGREDVDRFSIKEKYIDAFLKGKDVMKKRIDHMHETGVKSEEEILDFENMIKSIQDQLIEKHLQPVIRTYYHRTAFQIPGDHTVRISLDTDFWVIREQMEVDGFWRRMDADNGPPFNIIPSEDKAQFPYGILEVKLITKIDEEIPSWVTELMQSHLVETAPKFSKFTHGVASLYEGIVPLLPFWISEMDKDIRKTPIVAAEQAQAQEIAHSHEHSSSFIQSAPKSAGGFESGFEVVYDKKKGKNRQTSPSQIVPEREVEAIATETTPLLGGIRSRNQTRPLKRIEPSVPVILPPKVKIPVKVHGTVKVETKVWFANERTYFKNTNVALILVTFGIALINTGDSIARFSGLLYALISVGLLAYGWFMYQKRLTMIKNRDPGHFDDFVGPIIICLALFTAVGLNFYLKLSQLSTTDFWATY